MRELVDQAGPYVLAVLVHAAAAGVLVLSVQWPGLKQSAPEVVDSVEATVVDEERVRLEIERIRDRETAKRRAEEERAEVAREQREHEERRRQEAETARLAEEGRREEARIARLAEEERRREAETARLAEEERRREAETARLAEEGRRKEAEAARVAEERRRMEARIARLAEEESRREAETARLAEEGRRKEAEAARAAEERRRKEAEAAAQRAEEQRRQEVEKARRRREIEMARRQAEAERRAQQAEADRRRREDERARRELLAREEQRLEQERKAIFAKALEEYIGAIESSVARNWRRPTGVPPGLKCTVNVVQAPNGKVLRVEIAQSSGNIAFDRSVEQAVLAASPLPRPRQKAVFDREIVFRFNPRS